MTTTLLPTIPAALAGNGKLFANAYFVFMPDGRRCEGGFVIATKAGHEVMTASRCANGVAYFDCGDERKYHAICNVLNRADLQFDALAAEVSK